MARKYGFNSPLPRVDVGACPHDFVPLFLDRMRRTGPYQVLHTHDPRRLLQNAERRAQSSETSQKSNRQSRARKNRKKSSGNGKKKEEEEVERTHRLLSLRELRAVHLPVPL